MVELNTEAAIAHDALVTGMEQNEAPMQKLASKMVEYAVREGGSTVTNGGMIGASILAAAALIATTYSSGTKLQREAPPESAKKSYERAVLRIFETALRTALEGVEEFNEQRSAPPV